MTSTLGPEWHLSPDGINILTENGSIKDYNKILTTALNTDIKEIGSPVLTNELTKEKTSKVVVQIQKIRNVSAPKANEQSQAAPRMLKLILTDGDTHVQALEISQINSISRERTPPGTKILLNNAKICSGYILLDSKSCTVLGGKVPHLYEKWEIAKSIQRNKRRASSNEDGPPPWVNFGAKIQAGNQENDFKSLGGKPKEVNKDNSEFELQRQGAIAEATSGAVRKVFGGRVKQNVQPVVNNQRQDRGKNKSKFTQKERDVEEKPLKPSEKVSLFAFLEDKLPLNESTAKSTENYNQNYFKYDKNTSRAGDNQQKPYNSAPQRDFQNNQQGRKDYKQDNYRNSRPPAQNSRYDQQPNNYPKQYGKPNFPSNNYSKQQEKPPQQPSNNYVKPEEKPQQTSNNYVKQQEKQTKPEEERPFNNKTYQDDSHNAQKDKTVNDLTNNVSKMSLNSQFATRSLRQHLNLAPAKKNEDSFKKPQDIGSSAKWNVGDECMAKYWEDGKFYNAIITAITDRTYAVKFKGYGNIEEVLKTDCLPIVPNYNQQNFGNANQPNRRNDQPKSYSGSMEFRRTARNFK